MKKISAKIIADSIDPRGNRITSMILTFPRFILAEAKTHRIISGLHEDVTITQDLSVNSFREGSKNSASSRAIPFEKMVKMVEEDPFIPIAWQKNHKGMQGSEYITDQKIIDFKTGVWLKARDEAVHRAKELNGNLQRARSIFDIEELEDTGVTKQLCNRLLEPFMWHTVLVTATEFSNFFKLRCPQYNYLFDFYKSKKDVLKASKDGKYNDGRNFSDFTTEDWLGINSSQAEIHIQALAEAIWDAMNESIPNQLEAGEWHMPFMGNFNTEKLLELSGVEPKDFELICRKIATARAARLSYMTFDGEIDYEKDIKLHDRLIESHHMSPFEHCARAMSDEEYYSLVKGRVDSKVDVDGFINIEGHTNLNVFGWCNNFRGFIPYRYLITDNNG